MERTIDEIKNSSYILLDKNDIPWEFKEGCEPKMFTPFSSSMDTPMGLLVGGPGLTQLKKDAFDAIKETVDNARKKSVSRCFEFLGIPENKDNFERLAFAINNNLDTTIENWFLDLGTADLKSLFKLEINLDKRRVSVSFDLTANG